MKLLNRFYRSTLILVFFMLLVSCGDSYNQTIISSNKPIETIFWQLDGKGNIQFYTNDSKYYDYIFWNSYSQTDEALMSTVTATVIKQSGSLRGGYGIIFCYQDNNNFYRLLIDAAGQYSVYSRVTGTYNVIIPWSDSAHLNSGVGVANEISVTQVSSNNFSVKFNGTQEALFSDGNFSGGKAGFSAYVETQADENFPNTPEDIRFKLSLPVAYP